MTRRWDGGTLLLMPHTWGEDDPPLPPKYKGKHHQHRGQGGDKYRPQHQRKSCRKTAATAAVLALGALGMLGGVTWGLYLLLLFLITQVTP